MVHYQSLWASSMVAVVYANFDVIRSWKVHCLDTVLDKLGFVAIV